MSLQYEPSSEPLPISASPLSSECGTCETVMALAFSQKSFIFFELWRVPDGNLPWATRGGQAAGMCLQLRRAGPHRRANVVHTRQTWLDDCLST